MKKFYTNIVAFISVFLLFIPKTAKSADDNYTYKTENNKVTITGYSGKPVFVEIPEIIDGCRVTCIADNAFYNCNSLKSVKIPDTLEKIGNYAFSGCENLESIKIPENVQEIGINCFSGDKFLVYASLSEGINDIPESCFRGCESLETVVVPDTVENIGGFCFSGCKSLKNVSLGENVKKINDCSFYMCESLKSIYIPPSVEEIGVYSFGYGATANGTEKSGGFVIFCNRKTAAEKYAKSNRIDFENTRNFSEYTAIQRINGKRIYVPSLFFVGIGLVVISAVSVFYKKMQLKK